MGKSLVTDSLPGADLPTVDEDAIRKQIIQEQIHHISGADKHYGYKHMRKGERAGRQVGAAAGRHRVKG